MMQKYNIKPFYKHNLDNEYYSDAPEEAIVWQPDVYAYALKYAKEHGIKNIIDIGSGNGEKLYKVRDSFNLTFVDYGSNLNTVRKLYANSKGDHKYIEQNFEEKFPDLGDYDIKNSIIICSDVIEHIRDLKHLMSALSDYSRLARLMIISTPERIRTYGYDQDGQPLNNCHVREWTVEEMRNLLKDSKMKASVGLTRSNDYSNARATICVLSGVDLQALKDETLFSRPGYLEKLLRITDNDEFANYGIVQELISKNAIALANPLRKDYFAKHLKQALSQGYSIKINKFKFINNSTTELYYKSGIENVDRLMLQYVGTSIIKGELDTVYDIVFTIVFDHAILSEDGKPNPVMSNATLSLEYIPEMFFGMTDEIYADTLTALPNQANVDQEKSRVEEKIRLLEDKIRHQEQRVAELGDHLDSLYRNPALYTVKFARKSARKLKHRVGQKH